MSAPLDAGPSALLAPVSSLSMPVIVRTGIRWSGGRGNRPLVLALSFENPGRRPTAETTARIQVAEFGVFQAWRSLLEVEVPEIEPGEREIVTGLAPAAGLPRVPAARDRQSRVLDVHYVGNINVFVTRDAAVERHVRRTIGLRAGKPNLSRFFVGDGEPDSYRFSVVVCEPGWDLALRRGDAPGSPEATAPGIALGAPVLIAREVVTAVIRPPEGAESGRLAIGVERGSTGKTALVEFELDLSRLGSRCYVL